MERIMRARPSPATVIALVALFVALGGTAFSALRIPDNSITSEELKNGKAVKNADVVNDTLQGNKIKESTLGQVPSASNADMLDNLDSADFLRANAKAADASLLDGLDSADFLRSNAKAADADLLDGMNSTAFLGSNAAAGGDLTGNYPNPEIAPNAVGAGDVANGSLGTAELANSIPAARVTHSADQIIADNTVTTLAFDQERYDTTANMHDTLTNNSRLTAPVTGIYAVTAQVEWTANATGLRELLLRKNGSINIGIESSTPGTPGFAAQELTTQVRLAAGDFVEARVFQNSGINVVVIDELGASEASPEFSMTWLAPGP